MGGTTPPTTSPRNPPDGPPRCPETFDAILSSPAENIAPNSWLEVLVDRSNGSARVVVKDPAIDQIVGSLAGVRNLSVLVNCIDDGVEYQALVTAVDGGRVDVTVTKQG